MPRADAHPPEASAVPLAVLRRRAGLTQEDLAERAALAVRSVRDIERGVVARPRRASLEALATALELNPDERDRFVEGYRRCRVAGVEARPGPAGPAQLPADTAAFVGRAQQLAVLDDLIDRATTPTAAVISAVDGVAGVGKTALAVRWAYRVRDRFPDGQLFVDLRGYGPLPPADPATVLGSFLRSLDVPVERIPTDAAERAALYRTELASRRVLVFLDNARDAAQVRPLLPGGGNCLAVVTSRNRLRGLSARDGAHRVVVDQLTDAEARTLLARLAGTDALAVKPAVTGQVLTYCAGLPLPLRIVGERLAAGQSMESVAEQLTEAGLAALDDPDDELACLRTVFSWSYQALPDDVAALFRLLSVAPGRDIAAPGAVALAGAPEQVTRALLARLTAAHLLEERNPGRYEFHDLVRVYARECADREDAEPVRHAALTRLLDHYRATALAAVESGGLLDPTQRTLVTAPPVEPGFDSAERALAWLDSERGNLLAAAELSVDNWPTVAADLSTMLRRYLLLHSHRDDGVALHSCALRAARASGAASAASHALTNLGVAWWQSGQYDEAERLLGEALDTARQVGDRYAETRVLNNLALVYERLGRYQRAGELLDRALVLAREAGDRGNEMALLENLGLMHQRLGRLAEAQRGYLDALTMTRAHGWAGSESQILQKLGEVNRELGHLAEANTYLTQALAAARADGLPLNEGLARCGLGRLATERGAYAEATELQLQALALAHHSKIPAFEAEVLNALGETARAAGRDAEAVRRHGAALRLVRETHDRYEQAWARFGMAEAYSALGRRPAARAQWQRALAIFTELGMPAADQVRARLSAIS